MGDGSTLAVVVGASDTIAFNRTYSSTDGCGPIVSESRDELAVQLASSERYQPAGELHEPSPAKPAAVVREHDAALPRRAVAGPGAVGAGIVAARRTAVRAAGGGG
jgi:hypothetical protein